jgi:hypothetical protein
MNNVAVQAKAALALEFLNNHPALQCSYAEGFFGNNCFYMVPCSKYGEDGGKACTIRRNDPQFKKFKNRFETDDNVIYVSHKEKHGESWKLDHVRYGYDISFFVYDGNFEKTLWTDDAKYWIRYDNVHSYKLNFEESIIDCAKTVKKIYGNFNVWTAFLTEGEIKNHQECDREFNVPDSKYIHIPLYVTNRRWLKWFVQTDYCKKYWKNEFDKLIENTPNKIWDLSKGNI